jgi:hypothetical protein
MNLKSSCISLPTTEITGICHYSQLWFILCKVIEHSDTFFAWTLLFITFPYTVWKILCSPLHFSDNRNIISLCFTHEFY